MNFKYYSCSLKKFAHIEMELLQSINFNKLNGTTIY